MKFRPDYLAILTIGMLLSSALIFATDTPLVVDGSPTDNGSTQCRNGGESGDTTGGDC